MRLKVLAILDPFQPYSFKKDTSHLLLLTLARRGHFIDYADPSDLFFNGRPAVHSRRVTVLEKEPYFTFHPAHTTSPVAVDHFDLVLMRKDPPVDLAYLTATHLLSLAADRVWVINHPQALRDWNEKLSIFQFPRFIPPTIVSSNPQEIAAFVDSQGGRAVLKELDGFAGKGVRKIGWGETVNIGEQPVMAQAFLPQVATEGEKRIFMIDGEAWGALLKFPPEGGFITNPDLGGRLQATEITSQEKELCQEVGVFLKKNGIFFAGLDLIDGKLTEINITSPGLLWEWNEIDNRRHEEEIVDRIERKLKT